MKRSKAKRGKALYYLDCYDSVWFRLVMFFALTLMLTACGAPASAPAETQVQTALPTPTLEPTFTPKPSPTAASQPSPTAPATEPTPTATHQVSLLGRILDQAGGQPVAGATVNLDAFTATTDADGHYTLTGLSPGQYVLAVTREGYDPALSSILTLNPDRIATLDLTLYAADTTPYPQDPMLTNPLDPNGVPTPADAERMARLQGLAGQVVNVEETKLRGQFLVNYKLGDEVRSAVAELSHDAWQLTDDTGQVWWIIKVCGNLARPISQEIEIVTPKPVVLPAMVAVRVDGLVVRNCASEECAEVGSVEQGTRLEVLGCLEDGSWCQVGLPGGESGWCTGNSLQQLAVVEAIPVVKAVLPTVMPVAVASGEGKIVFISRYRDDQDDHNFEIYTINPDGSDLTRLTNHPAWDGSPEWSPDGQKIAFHSDRDDLDNCNRMENTTCNREIYVMNADGSDVTRLTNHPAIDTEPTWSPDGQKIAFISQRDASPNLYVMNADGTGVTRLMEHFQSDMQPAWSPDGQKIAFVLYTAGNADIYLINIDGSGLTRITDSPRNDLMPAWSPDGQKIAFVSYRDATSSDIGNSEIYVMNADGSGLTRITYNPTIDSARPGADEDPTWSPDGKRIAFRSYRNGNPHIYVMNADGSSVTQITFGDSADYVPDWSR